MMLPVGDTSEVLLLIPGEVVEEVLCAVALNAHRPHK